MKMNTAAAQQHAEFSLPPISQNSNKRTQSARCSRTKQKATQQTEPVSDNTNQKLSKAAIARFKNSLKQNICVDLLQEGYHRSFSELYSLLSTDCERRAAAEPLSDLRLQTPLEEQRVKLETLKEHLSQAEQAERNGSWSVVSEHRLFLGQYFSSPEDLWLRMHFFCSCAEQERRCRPATEARACLAELYLQQGEVEQARQQAELCMEKAEDDSWLDSAGQPLKVRARHILWRSYSRLADNFLEAADYREALTLLHKGHSMATESEDKQMESEASFQLGLTYQKTGDHNTAKQYFNTCIQLCDTLQDADGLGESYKAMAQSTESEGNIQETIRFLEKLANISRSNGLQNTLAETCLHLGNIFYIKTQYKTAYEYFLQGYEVACNLEDVALLQKAQVLVASARTHIMIKKYSADVELATPDALQRLLAWKAARVWQEFSED